MKEKSIILVHPTFSIPYIFTTIKNFGYKIVTIVTALESLHIKPELLREHSDYIFYGNCDPEHDLFGIKDLLSTNNLEAAAIVNGIDFTLYYTDYLQKHILSLPIDLKYSKLRMNKYEVNHLLEEHNIKIIPSLQINCKDDVATNIDKINALGWPIIAKPSEDTAAMSAILLVNNMAELNAYLDKYLGQKNPYYQDKIINKIILQTYIPNSYEEFVIDFVSYQGKHYCDGIVLYDKEKIENKYQIYRRHVAHTLNQIPAIAPVIEYIRSILDALKVNFGPTHNEVFWDRKDSFYLVESNSRIPGNGFNEMYQNFYGFSAITQLLNLLQGREITPAPYAHIEYSLVLDLYNTFIPHASKINLDGIKSVQEIVHFRNKNKLPKDFYKNYTRAENINAAVLLCNSNKELLDNDIKILLERESSGTLFQ